MTLGERIKQLRSEKGLSQSQLAEMIGISYPQMSRYEIKGVQPPADVLKKIADALDTTADYIISGSSDEKIKSSLKDAELIKQFKEMEQLPDEEKNVLLKIVSAYIRDFKAKQAYML
jgi:transcriptional regulator with XRE-family HTH domain